jgi:hypothetical protein
MALRTGHGRGKGQPHVEVLPVDELPAATPANTEPRERDASGRFVPGNKLGQSKRLRPGVCGLARVHETAPEFQPFARWGSRYATHRRSELARAHGGEISAGVGAIVESGALTMAASRYLQWQASRTGDPELFKESAQLAATARQHELAAWELAARECKARPKAKPWWAEPLPPATTTESSSAVADGQPEPSNEAKP